MAKARKRTVASCAGRLVVTVEVVSLAPGVGLLLSATWNRRRRGALTAASETGRRGADEAILVSAGGVWRPHEERCLSSCR